MYSQHVVRLCPHIETAPLPSSHSTILTLLSMLQNVIQPRLSPSCEERLSTLYTSRPYT